MVTMGIAPGPLDVGCIPAVITQLPTVPTFALPQMQSCRQLFNQDLPLGLRNWLKILLLWVLKPTLRKITSLSGWLPRWGRHATGRRLGARGDRRPQPSSKGLSLGVHVRSPQPEEHWCGEAAKCRRRPAGPSALIKSPQVTAHFRKDPPKAVLPGMRPRVQPGRAEP